MTNTKDLAPYFRNGLLYLPAKTVALLVDAGLDKNIGYAALHGLSLSDQRAQIGLISQALEKALSELETNTVEYSALNSPETQFMLTGRRVAV
jgi:hypothetical protein